MWDKFCPKCGVVKPRKISKSRYICSKCGGKLTPAQGYGTFSYR